MNNLQLKLIITLCLTLLFNFAHAKGEDKSLTLRSPSKEVRIDISWKNQELTYEIYFGETLILQPSKMKWKIGETELGKSIQQVQSKKATRSSRLPIPFGKSYYSSQPVSDSRNDHQRNPWTGMENRASSL